MKSVLLSERNPGRLPVVTLLEVDFVRTTNELFFERLVFETGVIVLDVVDLFFLLEVVDDVDLVVVVVAGDSVVAGMNFLNFFNLSIND